ncbi:MAG: hypothetical protein ACTSRU_07515 [Candidatus Hodarchaeales archaeon]
MSVLKIDLDSLLALLSSLKQIEDEETLNAIIYILQKKGFFKPKYDDFDFIFGDPWSNKIDLDLYLLEEQEYIVNTRTQGTIYLTEKGKEKVETIDLEHFAAAEKLLELLDQIPPRKLRILARIMYMKTLFPEGSESSIELIADSIHKNIIFPKEEIIEIFNENRVIINENTPIDT